MNTEQIISQLTGTAAERRTQLEQVVTVPSGRGPLTNSAFGSLTSPEAANQIFQILKVSAESYSIQYVVQGIDTSTEDWKERVDAIDATGNQQLESLKPLIRDWETMQVTRWLELGGTGEIPNVEEIQTVMDTITKAEKIANWKERFDAALNKIGTENQAVGVADVLAIADEMEVV